MRYEVIQSDESVLEFDNNVTIKESFVDGVVDFVEDKNTMVSANIGVIASKLPSNSMVYNTGATAIINAGISMNETNIGGIVGLNQGFVTSCVYSGNIVLNNNQNNYADAESVGGIVGYNDTLAEVKNCQTHGTISLKNTEKEVVTQSHYYMGGVVGTNNAGVLELCQSDALMQFENLNSVFAGGMVGCNRLGIVSYAISRGSIELKDVESITTAQVVGYSVSGYLEKVVTTTSINIDNSASLSRKVDVGLVTVFDSIENSPNFNKILADGTTEVYTRAVDGSVNYNLGLRYSYQKIVGQEDEEDIYATVLPNIFENVYRTSGLSFKKYKLEDNEKKEETIEISYVNKIGVSTPTPRWMIDYLDFKNYLNHNEVSLGTNLSKLFVQ